MRIIKSEASSQISSSASSSGSKGDASPIAQTHALDWNGEYVKAVRTASYNEFWMKAQILTGRAPPDDAQHGTISADLKIKSFTLVADSLLEPDQEAVNVMLSDKKNWRRLEILQLVSDYFDSSLKASSLCGTLLRCIEQARHTCFAAKAAMEFQPCTRQLDCNRCQQVVGKLFNLLHEQNPFSEPAFEQFLNVHDSYGALHKRLLENRKALNSRLKILKYCKSGFGILLVIALAGVSICAFVVVTHGIIAAAAAPLLTLPMKSGKTCLEVFRHHQIHLLSRYSSQLDAAARGTYTVNRILDTMTRLVTRLNDEIERGRELTKFGWDHREEHPSAQEVVQQLWKCQKNLYQQLEELEEHVYICFMTLNKARGLVIREIPPTNL